MFSALYGVKLVILTRLWVEQSQKFSGDGTFYCDPAADDSAGTGLA
jgi:hypothetical protein